MTDDIILDQHSGGSGEPREQHPTGGHIGVCVDVINLGERLEQFDQNKPKIVQKVAFVFMTGLKNAEGKYFELNREMTLSAGDRATLPKFIGTWRGQPLDAAEIKSGIKLNAFVGKPAQLSLIGKTNKKGNTYTNIDTVTPLMAQMTSFIPVLPAYTRADFWQTRITEYADEVAEFRRKQGVANAATARGAVAQAPSAPLSDADAVAKMQASEQAAQDSDLPPF